MTCALFAQAVLALGTLVDPVPVDLGGFRAGDGVDVKHDAGRERLTLSWPMTPDGSEFGRLVVDLRAGQPLIESMGLAATAGGESTPILTAVDPVVFVTVGSRENPPGRPPGMSVFNVFFDSPAKRPHQTFKATLVPKAVKVDGTADRASVLIDGLTAGPFSGGLRITVYAGARLVHVEALVSTDEANRAITYDAGLVSDAPSWTGVGWVDVEGALRRENVSADRAFKVKYRTIFAAAKGGTVASFPPPHSSSTRAT